MAPKPKPKASEVPTDGSLTVVGPEKGRRRAGRRFGPEPVVIAVADLDEDDLQAIRNDPALIVSFSPAPDPAAGGGAGASGT